MAKAAVNKDFKVSASGILVLDCDDNIALEIEDTGELRYLTEILADFKDKDVKITCTYNEDF